MGLTSSTRERSYRSNDEIPDIGGVLSVELRRREKPPTAEAESIPSGSNSRSQISHRRMENGEADDTDTEKAHLTDEDHH